MTFMESKGQHCRGCGTGGNAVAAKASFTAYAANRSVRVHYHCNACNSVWDEIFILASITQVVDLDDIVVELDDEDLG
jgi:hypothetical protein